MQLFFFHHLTMQYVNYSTFLTIAQIIHKCKHTIYDFREHLILDFFHIFSLKALDISI